jgi:hypothetical protein
MMKLKPELEVALKMNELKNLCCGKGFFATGD